MVQSGYVNSQLQYPCVSVRGLPVLLIIFCSLGSLLMRISFKVCDPHRIKRLALERKARYPDNRGCVVYSIGSNGDFNFELGMQVREKNVTIAPLFVLQLLANDIICAKKKEIGEGICEFHL